MNSDRDGVPYVPEELRDRPFTTAEALRAGVSPTALRGKAWRRIATEIYCWVEWQLDPWKVLDVWARLLPAAMVFAGDTAAWMHGLDYAPLDPVEVIVPFKSGVRSRNGLTVRRCALEPPDVVVVRSLRATSLHRTLVDGCARKEDGEALVALDMALRGRHTHIAAMSRYAGSTTVAGAKAMRRLVAYAEPAESPMETRTRWLFVTAGLGRPQVQVDLRDDHGIWIARVDMYYPSHRLAIEFDGGHHKERLVEDNRRQNLLTNAGYRVLRFTNSDLRDRPDVVIALVRAVLAEREAPFWRQSAGQTSGRHLFGAKAV